MKILMVAFDIEYPGTEGVASHVEGVVNAFNDLGHEVTLLVKRGKDQERKELKNNGKLRIRRFYFPPGKWKYPLYLQYCKTHITMYIVKYGIDVVYERSRMFGNYSMLWAKLFGKKRILEMNEPIIGLPVVLGTMKDYSRRYKTMVRWHKFFANLANIVTITHPIMGEGIQPEKLVSITYGVNPSLFNPSISGESYKKALKLTPGKTVLYAGSFRKWH